MGDPTGSDNRVTMRVRREWKRKSFVTAGKTWLMNRPPDEGGVISHWSFLAFGNSGYMISSTISYLLPHGRCH